MLWINDNRQRCGFGQLAQNPALDQASQDHANYLLTNFVTTHQQDPTRQGFTGVWPWDRAQFRSYGSTYVTENVVGDGSVNLSPNTEGYSQGLGAASYHALSTFGPWLDVGIAVSGVSQNSRWGVQMFGSRSSTSQLLAGDALATFPCEGTVLERPNHSVETPSPFAGTGRQDFSFGHPLIAMVRMGQTLVVDSWTLTRQGDSTPLANWRILTAANDPNRLLRPHQAVLIPDQPMVRGATYVVRIRGTNNGQAFDRTYTFSQDPNGRR
ncbi:CAP domain-containing protein [Piscinibacterium candidicorallinum]|uniref:CAP domain-containing protein n=1 Tax=Piscinibacterium candidicorallinum TaxID=1793872 RepID=A0ABV7H329_9BURK